MLATIPGIPALRSIHKWLWATGGYLACTLSYHSEMEMKDPVVPVLDGSSAEFVQQKSGRGKSLPHGLQNLFLLWPQRLPDRVPPHCVRHVAGWGAREDGPSGAVK